MHEQYRVEISETVQIVSFEESGVTHNIEFGAEPEIQIIEVLDRGLIGPEGPPGSIGTYDPGDLALLFQSS